MRTIGLSARRVGALRWRDVIAAVIDVCLFACGWTSFVGNCGSLSPAWALSTTSKSLISEPLVHGLIPDFHLHSRSLAKDGVRTTRAITPHSPALVPLIPPLSNPYW